MSEQQTQEEPSQNPPPEQQEQAEEAEPEQPAQSEEKDENPNKDVPPPENEPPPVKDDENGQNAPSQGDEANKEPPSEPKPATSEEEAPKSPQDPVPLKLTPEPVEEEASPSKPEQKSPAGSKATSDASIKSSETSSSSEANVNPERKEDNTVPPKLAIETKPPQAVKETTSPQKSSIFTPVIAKLKMDSAVSPSTTRSRNSSLVSSALSSRKASQPISNILRLSTSSASTAAGEQPRQSLVSTQTPIMEELVNVAEMVRMPTSSTVVDFAPEKAKVVDLSQRLSVASSTRNVPTTETQPRAPSISGQTLTPSVKVEDQVPAKNEDPVLIKKLTEATKILPAVSLPPDVSISDAVNLVHEPRKRDRVRCAMFPQWFLVMLFGHTVAKRLKAMLELAAGH